MSKSIGENLDTIRNLLNLDSDYVGNTGIESAWYVGAYGDGGDFSDTCIQESKWQNLWVDNSEIDDLVKSMEVGDRIAIKSSYTRKNDLPFDNNGKSVSVMGIKAIGIITKNHGDGKNIDVDWTQLDPRKEWFGPGCFRGTVKKVVNDSITRQALLNFTFADNLQDYSLCEEYYSELSESESDYDFQCDEVDGYSVEKLANILTDMYNEAESNNKDLTTAIHMFGYKYAEIITENNYSCTAIAKKSVISDNYHVEIGKGIRMFYALKNNEYGTGTDVNDIKFETFDFSVKFGKATNMIFYGTPGCGKSYHIEHDILGKDKGGNYSGKYEKDNIIRTTFYMDYTNTDFVGQILPKVTGEKVEYIFNPGPFTLALIQAIKNPDKKVALVIEEINRGNAPAIFGDIFQLLDRDDNSISEYGIKNVGIIDYLNAYNFGDEYNEIRYSFDEIKIPGNLYIYATMNTSDQNVFTLDTAFTRRWERKRMPNEFTDKCEFRGYKIPGMEAYTWENFVNAINTQIKKHIDDLQVNEDKQIGVYFVNKHLLLESGIAEKEVKEAFAYKVLEYLWNDVSKLDHEIIFRSFNTFEDVVKAYLNNGVDVFNPNIFKDVKIDIEESAEDDE